jgi:tetratricopeptide (TPR) repeat protein
MKSFLRRLTTGAQTRRDEPQPVAGGGDHDAAAASMRDAMASQSAGRAIEAENHCRRAIAADPSNFDALHMLGVLAYQRGESVTAADWLGRAVAADPGNADARHNFGVVSLAAGRVDIAEGALRKALAQRPDWDGAYASLGNVLRARGDRSGAEACMREALRLNPSHVDALNNLANLCVEADRDEEAEGLYCRGLAVQPRTSPLWNNLGRIYLRWGDWSRAEVCFRSALDADRNNAAAHCNLGFALLQQKRLNEAETSLREALSLQPGLADALVNLSSVRWSLSDIEGAQACCTQALALDPAHVPALNALAALKAEGGDLVAAERSFRDVVAVSPGSADAHYGLSMILLKRGEYLEGFERFESRFEAFRQTFKRERNMPMVANDAQRWRGESLVGRRLLVWTEQGCGDSLMMLRYLPLLAERGPRELTVLCEPELGRLVGAVAGVHTVVTGSAADLPHGFDLHCPTMSLPHAFHTTPADIPATEGCVRMPADLVDAWHARLPASTKRRVGLAWAGRPTLRDDARRSIPLQTLEPLLDVDGVEFVSLQWGAARRDEGVWRGRMRDPMQLCADFMDTAALICNLDLVISVDTAVAHLAGLLGKPVWLLNRAGSEWRWGQSRDVSPWYRSMRIFNQHQSLDWAPVVASVKRELQSFVS